jgi:hypothetical protein
VKLRPLSWPLLLGLSAAVLVLSVLLNLDYPADPLFTWSLVLPSLDVWLLLIPLAMAARSEKKTLWGMIALTWMLFLVLRLIRIGDTVVPMYLDRPFNLYIDSGYLFGLYDLLKTTSGQGGFLLSAAYAAMAVLGFCLINWYAWRLAARAFANNRIRFSFLGGSALILAAGLLWGWQPAKPSALVRLGQEIRSIHRQTEQQKAFVARLEQTAKAREALPTTLHGLGGADVLLFIVESYGQVVFSQSQYRQGMIGTMTRFGKTLSEHGFEAVSSNLLSPTYGGSSWLAHGTLETGVRVGNDLENAALLRSAVQPLAALFRRNGYRSIAVMPGTRFAFPQGSYFGYDQDYYAWHFDYRGPPFGWAPMPDQFVLDWVRRREVQTRTQPLFIRFALISSHAAFSVQPPFIVDWETIGNGSLYQQREPITFPVTWPDLKNAGPAYLRSLDYEFAVLGDYLARFVDGDALIIILGDHQPNLQLTGPGESWSVPVHIISRNPRLLQPFRQRGYTPGLIPAQPLPHAGMETFFPGFLEDFQ